MESSEEGEGTYRFRVYKVYTSCDVMENWLAFHCRTKETGVLLRLCDGLVRIYVLCDSHPCSATGDAKIAHLFCIAAAGGDTMRKPAAKTG